MSEASRAIALDWVHVPTPGDHYSPATGSAVMTVIYELARRHEAAGGRTRVLVTPGAGRGYDVGEAVVTPFGPLPGRAAKLLQAGRARLGLSQNRSGSHLDAVGEAVGRAFEGAVFLHNEPGALPPLRRSLERAHLCLYAHNVLFRTYTRRDARRAVDAADRVVCVSEYLAAEMAHRLGPVRAEVAVVLNGVDTRRFVPAARPPDEPVILFVGRTLPRKGPHLLIEAARRIAGSRRRFRLRFVGSSGFAAGPLTPYEQRLRRLAAPIAERVEFQPFVDRAGIVEQYQRGSIFCAPSDWDDPCPLTVPEALACGLPTVAAQRGGIPELAAGAALYFEPPDVGALADRLAYLVDDERARQEWGARARARAECITWERQYRLLRSVVEG